MTDGLLRSYEKCPRRFFYTHVLGLGGARKTTAFTQTHDCLYEVIKWLAAKRIVGAIDAAEVQKEFDRIWVSKGPIDHAYAKDYRQLADRLVDALVREGAGKRFLNSEPLAIDFSTGKVFVTPDEISQAPDGTIVLRRVRTGHLRGDEYDRLEYTLYHLAGRQAHGARYSVQAVHLTDEVFEVVSITSRKLANRQEKSEEMLRSALAGIFPPKRDQITCPRCPHFFICAAAGNGAISLQ